MEKWQEVAAQGARGMDGLSMRDCMKILGCLSECALSELFQVEETQAEARRIGKKILAAGYPGHCHLREEDVAGILFGMTCLCDLLSQRTEKETEEVKRIAVESAI